MQLIDRMIGDPFLVNVYKKLLPQASSDEETVMILDLLLCCGEDDYDIIVNALKKIKQPELITAFYLRVAVLYFFRFHRDKDRKALRKLLKDIQKNCKAISLKSVVA